MKNLLLFLTLSFASTTSFGATYLCITEASGGVRWNGREWHGAAFTPRGKFLVKYSPELELIGWYSFGNLRPSAFCR
jgi:hypothetical protein